MSAPSELTNVADGEPVQRIGDAIFGRPSAEWIAAFAPAPAPATGIHRTMIVRTVELALIDVGGRLRALDPSWVDLLAEEIGRDGQIEPIRVVERAGRYQLIDGARRIAALTQLGRAEVEARIEPESALLDAAYVRLGEIKGNMMRGELTVLDRALYLAAWREMHESVHAAPKRGRKSAAELSAQSARISGPANDDAEDPFLLSFTEAAQRALNLSRRSLYLALKIATIDPAEARRLAGHPSADSRNEMLLLAEQTVLLQRAVVDRLVDGSAPTVAEALILLAGKPAAPKLSAPERIHQTFARLRPQEQDAFFDLNAEAVERWSAARAARAGNGRRANVRSVA